MKRLFTLTLLLLAAGWLSNARAGLFDDDEARKQIADLKKAVELENRRNDTRIKDLEENVRDRGMVQLLQQIEALKEEIARLRGQIEVLTSADDQLSKKQRDFYLDLDSRMKRLEAGGQAPAPLPTGAAPTAPPLAGTAAPPLSAATPPVAPPGVPPGANPPPATPPAAGNVAIVRPPPAGPVPLPGAGDQSAELRAYDNASNVFKRNDFSGAVTAFNQFIRDFGQSALVPNAYYWIGISQANLKDYRGALAAQETVIRRFPDSPKAPDAMLAVAQLQVEQGDTGSARDTLDGLINKYPQSDAAGKARTRLAQLRR